MNQVRREQGADAVADEPLNPTVPDESAEPAQAAADPGSEAPEPTESGPTEEERRAETERWIKEQLAGKAAVSTVTAAKVETAEDSPAVSTAESAEGTEDSAEGTEGSAGRTEGSAGGTEGSADPDGEESAEPTDAEGAEEPEAEEPEPEGPEEPTYRRFDITGSDPAALAEAAEAARAAIENGECVVLPTDTVYGIGVDAFDADAVQRLLDAKERGRDMPPPVLIGDPALIRALADEVPELVTPLTEKHWPGPLTVIVKARDSLRIDLGETRGTIGLRVPDYELTRALLRQTGPMAVSSANLSGRSAALTCDEAIEYFGNRVSVYLDGGPVQSTDGASSSMVDFSQHDHGELLRAGALSVEVLRETLPDLDDLTVPAEDPEPTDPEPTDVGPAAEAAAAAEGAAADPEGTATNSEDIATEAEDVAAEAEGVAADPDSEPTPADEPDSSEDIERLIEQHADEPVPTEDQQPDDQPAAADQAGATQPSEPSSKT